MNLLFFMTPKANCSYLNRNESVREALERMEIAGYAALPIIDSDGVYCGTLTEGDLLWAVKNLCKMDMHKAEETCIMEITHRKDNLPVRVTAQMDGLLHKALDQNFVPVVDDRDIFIGIVTRRSIMRYFISEREKSAAPQA